MTQHETLTIIYHWPLHIWGDSEENSYCIECDYCGRTLWESDTPDEVNLNRLYKAISQHRMDGCPNHEHN